MPRSSAMQTSFAGGQWGPLSIGRASDPRYATALSLCLNSFPFEETPWTVRSGTQFLMPTVGRTFAKLLTFSSTANCSFAMEFTEGQVRFDTPYGCVCTNDGTVTISDAVSSGGNIVITVGSLPETWLDGDLIQLVPPSVGQTGYPFDPVNNMWYLQNKVLSLSTISGDTFLLADDLGNLLGPSSANWDVAWVADALIGCQIIHHAILATGYDTVENLQALRAVQAEIDSVLLSGANAPFVIQVTTPGDPATNLDPVFVYEQLNMMDGPYLDPQGQQLTISGYSGAITCTTTIGTATTANAFAATDIGRSVRIFTQPPLYDPTSTYPINSVVTDVNGAWWQALQAIQADWYPGNLAIVGGISTAVWGPAPGAGTWAWGIITTYTSPTEVIVTLDTRIPNMVLNPANSDVAYFWQLGVYSDTTSWPTCGGYYQGRLWLGGAVPNRFDTCCSNGIPPIIGQYTVLFSPTDPYNNVLDDSGMSYILDANGLDQIQWMLPDAGGLLMGTEANEFLIGASTLSDPITPTSIQDYPRTKYGSTNQEAIRVGMAALFTQRNGRRVMEYVDDAFSSKPTGRHLNENARNLTVSGVQLLAYTEEPVPMVWALMNNGMLAGCTYRRFSRFVQTPPETEGWHWNLHGAGNRVFTSMCAVPDVENLLDYLFTVTQLASPAGQNTPTQTNYYVELMTPPQEPPTSLLTGFLADEAGGWAPGHQGLDCSGGNQATFTPQGYITGLDSTQSAAVTNEAFFTFNGYSSGQTPPWGATNVLGPAGSVFFPGTVMLYNIAPFDTANGNAIADASEVSLSVWVGTTDSANYGFAGYLVCPPHLDAATWTAHPEYSGAEFIGGYTNDPDGLAPFQMVQWFGTSGSQAEYQLADPGSAPAWSHLMISLSINNSTGVVTATIYINNVEYCLNTAIGTLTNPGAILGPFNSSRDGIGNEGLNVWSVGGQAQVGGGYSPSTIPRGSNLIDNTKPSLLQALALTQGPAVPGGVQEGLYTPMGVLQGVSAPTVQALLAALAGQLSAVSEPLYTGTFAGGTPNTPYNAGVLISNVVTGYIGNVAELWVAYGQFLDWSNSAVRQAFQEEVGGHWGPVPLGYDGSLPLSGTKPWLYLSGGPLFFPMNRATCNSSTGIGAICLTEIDTSAPIVNFKTGEGGGLQVSQLAQS